MTIRPLLATGVVMLGTAGAGFIEDHSVDIKTVCSVGTIVLAGTWALSRRFRGIEDKLEEIKEVKHRLEVVEKLVMQLSGFIPKFNEIHNPPNPKP